MGGGMSGNELRLSDRIAHALELALDQGELATADLLGRALEMSLTRFGGPEAMERREPDDEIAELLIRLDDALRRAVRED